MFAPTHFAPPDTNSGKENKYLVVKRASGVLKIREKHNTARGMGKALRAKKNMAK